MDRKSAPVTGCRCAVCRWLRENVSMGNGPVRPGTAAWEALMRATGADGRG